MVSGAPVSPRGTLRKGHWRVSDTTDLVEPQTAALLLGVTSETVKNLARRGVLRFTRRRGVRLFSLDDVLKVREERRRHPERRGRLSALVTLARRAEASTS